MIAAVLLLFLDEETAFWGVVAVVEHILPPKYYTQTMIGRRATAVNKPCLLPFSWQHACSWGIGVQVDQRVLRDLVAERLPKLSTHLDRSNVDLSMVTFNFFLTASVDSMPIETALRILDCFLFEGDKILFRFGLAMLKMHEQGILAKTDKAEMFMYLR